MMQSKDITHKAFLIIGLLFFACFLSSILTGKISLLLGSAEPIHLSDITEFLLLFAAVVFLVIFVIQNTDTK